MSSFFNYTLNLAKEWVLPRVWEESEDSTPENSTRALTTTIGIGALTLLGLYYLRATKSAEDMPGFPSATSPRLLTVQGIKDLTEASEKVTELFPGCDEKRASHLIAETLNALAEISSQSYRMQILRDAEGLFSLPEKSNQYFVLTEIIKLAAEIPWQGESSILTELGCIILPQDNWQKPRLKLILKALQIISKRRAYASPFEALEIIKALARELQHRPKNLSTKDYEILLNFAAFILNFESQSVRKDFIKDFESNHADTMRLAASLLKLESLEDQLDLYDETNDCFKDGPDDLFLESLEALANISKQNDRLELLNQVTTLFSDFPEENRYQLSANTLTFLEKLSSVRESRKAILGVFKKIKELDKSTLCEFAPRIIAAILKAPDKIKKIHLIINELHRFESKPDQELITRIFELYSEPTAFVAVPDGVSRELDINALFLSLQAPFMATYRSSHPLQYPLNILQTLARSTEFNSYNLPSVTFLGEYGSDEFGLRRDLVTSLMSLLFPLGEKETSLIKGEKIDSLFLPLLDEENEAKIQALGILFASMITDKRYLAENRVNAVTGLRFHPILFQTLSGIKFDHLGNTQETLRSYLKTGFSKFFKKHPLLLESIVNENEDDFYAASGPKLFEEFGLDITSTEGFIEAYSIKPACSAISCIGKEIKRAFLEVFKFPNQAWEMATRDKGEFLSKVIQGRISKELVLRVIEVGVSGTEEPHPEMQAHIERWIRECSLEELEKFVIMVSGASNILEWDKIKVVVYPNLDGPMLPVFHTCSKTLDVTTYEEYENFKTDLEKSLRLSKESGFGLA